MRRRLALLVVVLLPFAALSVPPVADPDPQHVGNRLLRHLYSRTTTDGKPFDAESLEPVLVQHSKFLTEGESHRQALALLDEFVKTQAEKPITDPLRRAVLQRDLWGVFAVTAGQSKRVLVEEPSGRIYHTEQFIDPGDTDLERVPQRRDLQRRLARAMRAVALTAEEIKALPANLDAAVGSGAYAADFDPQHLAQPFLPAGLTKADGPWVPIANWRRDDGLAAPEHTAFTKGRSVFVVLIRVPKGRAAAEAFVKRVDDATQKGNKLPAVPHEAQTALLRRMLLIDDRGRLHESPLTESVELRVYDEDDNIGRPFAFHLRRADLFAGRAGGLHAVGPEQESVFDFQVAGPQAIAARDPLESGRAEQPWKLMDTCSGCHRRKSDAKDAAILSIAALHTGRQGQMGLRVTTAEEQVRATKDWLQRSYTWGLLQGMWEGR